MKTKEVGQLEFLVTPQETFIPEPQPVKPVAPKEEYQLKSLITFSQIERIIYSEITKVRPSNIFDASQAVGWAIDYFLVPANFVYRFRNNYCFPPELYPEWDLRNVFKRFYPTGPDLGNILELLEKHRPNFTGRQNPLDPAHPSLERRNIKKALIPLWEEIGRKFRLDSLNLQSIMTQQRNFILLSDTTATAESIREIGRRIVEERFAVLVDDDKNYTYLATPDCLLVYQLDGKVFPIQVRPDYIKSLREKRKSVKKRNIVTKRIVGDFKDSPKADLENLSSPFGKTMLVYNWLLTQIGERFKQNQLTMVKLPNGQRRRVFLIPQEVTKPLPQTQVQTVLEFLRQTGEQIFSQMPVLTPEHEEFAKSILEKALRISQKIKFD